MLYIYIYVCVYVLLNHLRCALPHMCLSQQELHTEADFNDPVLLRKKRMAQAEKNTCQLFIQTDHLFFKYYKTREAVIAQVMHRFSLSPFRTVYYYNI